MKKIATATAATLVLGGSMAAGVLTSTTAQADSRPAKGVHQTGYVQRGSTVTVYRDGKVAAKITAESVARSVAGGRLKVKVQAKKAVSFTAGQFLWEDTTGADYETSNPRKTYRAKANSTRTSRSATTRPRRRGDLAARRHRGLPRRAWKVDGAGFGPTPRWLIPVMCSVGTRSPCIAAARPWPR